MIDKTCIFLVASVAFVLGGSIHAQQAGFPDSGSYNPFFVVTSSSSGTNRYDATRGILTLPHIFAWPVESGTPQTLLNSVFQFKGDNLFELIAVDELQPQQECTRAEVANAIPLLSLDLDIATAEALIGCEARIDIGGSDLETGRLVYAIFQGADGVPNSYLNSSGYIGGTGSSTWIPQSGGLVGYSPFRLTSSPNITLGFRENVLESVSYSPEEPNFLCLNADLSAGFESIQASDTLENINTKLACTGSLQQVFLRADLEQRAYIWQSQTQPPVFSNFPAQVMDTVRQSVTLSVLNDTVIGKQLTVSGSYHKSSICSVDEIIAVAGMLEAGQSAAGLSELLGCGPRNESVFQNETSLVHSYQWSSQVPNDSLFVTKNRALSVTTRDGVIEAVHLVRN